MKKALFGLSLLAMVSFSMISCDDDDDIISEGELPQNAQNFIAEYFGGQSYSRVEKEGKSYSVELGERGSQIEVDFNADGEWTEVDGDDGIYIPTGFILPKIVAYVEDNFPSSAPHADKVNINGIEKKSPGFEVDLVTSGADLVFDNNGDFVREDR